MTREALHELIERIPEGEIAAAQRFLEYLATSIAFRATRSAPPDDEPVTKGDVESITQAHSDIKTGKVVSHEEVLRGQRKRDENSSCADSLRRNG